MADDGTPEIFCPELVAQQERLWSMARFHSSAASSCSARGVGNLWRDEGAHLAALAFINHPNAGLEKWSLRWSSGEVLGGSFSSVSGTDAGSGSGYKTLVNIIPTWLNEGFRAACVMTRCRWRLSEDVHMFISTTRFCSTSRLAPQVQKTLTQHLACFQPSPETVVGQTHFSHAPKTKGSVDSLIVHSCDRESYWCCHHMTH